jgi:hypothetical protein
MSEEKMCYLQRNGKTQGPFPKEKLEAGLKSGRLRATDLISTSLGGPWKAIADVPQLAKRLKPVDDLDDLFSDEPTPPRKRSNTGTQTVELTSKKFKAAQLLGAVGIVAGMIIMTQDRSLGLIIMLIGLAVALYGVLAAWWFNG